MGNPGMQILCTSDFHQGNENIFSYLSRGRQCVANSAVFLMTVYFGNSLCKTWCKETLHKVLYVGDHLYQLIQESGRSESDEGYLHPDRIPCHLKFDKDFVHIKIKSTLSGSLSPDFKGNLPLLSLEHAFAIVCNTVDLLKLMIYVSSGSAVGIVYHDSKFYVFDSHARDSRGLPSELGSCILGTLGSLSELCSFLRKLSMSLSSLSLNDVQFDLHNINVNKPKKLICKNHNSSNVLQLPYCLQTLCPVLNKVRKRKNMSDACVRNGKRIHSVLPDEHGSENFSMAHDNSSKEIHLGASNESNAYPEQCEGSNVVEKEMNDNIVCIDESNTTTIAEDSANVSPTNMLNVQSVSGLPDHETGNLLLANQIQTDNIIQVLHTSEASQEQSTKIYKNFQSKIKDGPMYVCTSCTQTFFRHSVNMTENITIKEIGASTARSCFTDTKSVNSKEWICKTCLKSIQQGKVPGCSIANNMKFPAIPDELKLTHMEERLVAPRLAFMQVKQLPRGGQLNLKGNIVNVPADVNATVRQLPRLMDNLETIPVKLKRKLSYKHCVAFEQIRPVKILEAARWLVQNSQLFKNEGIEVNNCWLDSAEASLHDSETADASANVDETTGERLSAQTESQDLQVSKNPESTNSTSDEWTEDDNFHNRLTGNTDTMLQPMDFREYNQILSLAPGENQTPLGLFQDMYSEYLAFPTIYCGQARPDNLMRKVPVHYSTICKWELRNVDRRTAMCIPNIFYKLKRLQIKQIQDKVSLAVRKCKTKGKKMTVSEVLSAGFVDTLVKQDDGFRVLRTLRGSPPYWEQAKKDVFAMIRQLGMPSWFCSFSAAETKWAPLLQCLSKLVHNKTLSEEEVISLTWEEKCVLIKSDPVTCARYFDHRFQSFLMNVLKDESNPVGEILDYFYRVEFQQRGSPHVHMLVWVKDAPVYNGSNQGEVANFIDKHVTCKKDDEMPTLVNYQTHRHARTCRKKGKAICRFNFPLPPMPYTVILDPLQDEEEKSKGQENFKKVAKLLSELKSENVTEFDQFLGKLEMSLEVYLQSIQSTLSVSKVFLKRSLEETRINSYNRTSLKCWEANMDIQYILDPYACVSYIVSYISKGQRGLSNLLYEACKEAKQKDSDIRQQVRRIGNQFLSHVEVGAQEAAYLVLQMPLRKSTRDVVFIETNEPEKRTVLLKSYSSLKELPKSSTNVEADNVLKRYHRRPHQMNKYCYADFVSWFDTSFGKSGSENVRPKPSADELPEEDYSLDLQDDVVNALEQESDLIESNQTLYEFKDGTIMKKRKKQKVIRYQPIALNADREGHYRQLVMLFTAWRNEEVDLFHTCQTYEESYMKMKNVIDTKKCNYEKATCDLDETMLLNHDEIEEYQRDAVLPENEHQESIDSSIGCSASETYGCFDPGTLGKNTETDMHCQQYDIGQDLGIARRQIEIEQLPLKEMRDEDYREMVQNLNEKQKEFFYNVLHHFKTSKLPLYTFLTGGAGVGKSVVLRSLYQALLKFYNGQAGENPDAIKILLCAPTGKAAHNIGGNTIHSAFGIPVGRGFDFKPLDNHQLDTMRCKYFHLKVVFIDEISMVGNKMFNFINLRLQELKGCCKLFGGVSIVAFGDLFQLKPVMDSWIFAQSRSGLECLGTSLWKDNFTVYELDQIMRQKDDLSFAELLNRLRKGNHMIPEDIQVLQSRVLKGDRAVDGDLTCMPHLFTSREESNLHNLQVLSKIPGELKIVVHAVDTVSGQMASSLKDKVLSKVPSDAGKTMGLQKELCLAIGPPFELCLNVSVEDGLTNGTSCIIRKFDYRVLNSQRCSIVWVELEDPSSGVLWRQKYINLYRNDTPRSWTPILEVTRSFSIQYYKSYSVVRRQFPLHMSAGKTIHKAQGSTLNNAVVHFGKKKTDHIHYVGLSRVRNLYSVHILELNEKKIATCEGVKQEMERIKNTSPMPLTLPPLTNSDLGEYVTLCFHNCRSLKKHIGDMKQDVLLMQVDVLALCETRVFKRDAQFEIAGYSFCCAEEQQCRHGMAIYNKKNVDYISFSCMNGVETVITRMNGINICYIYIPPRLAVRENVEAFIHTLQSLVDLIRPTILMGDFNQDALLRTNISHILSEQLSFSQLITSVTTDYESCLDHIYINFPSHTLHSYGTLESYYSDHKPIFIKLKF